MINLRQLLTERFWLVLILGLGAIFIFIAFPVIAVFLVIAAIAFGLIVYDPKKSNS